MNAFAGDLFYDEAVALATQMDTEFAGLPLQVAPLARGAIRLRRRLAGDIDGVLREDTARLAAARAARNVPAEIEILQSLAVSYRAANSVNQQANLLEQALLLERGLLGPSGATHGVLDEDAPLFSAVLTSGSPDAASRLSRYEVSDLRVRARLVVLSACETGLGRLQRGDEVTGLTRTFLLAGADTIVSSLWQVSDDSTALLMAGFYHGLHDELDPAQALRRSALAVRKQSI